MITLLPNFGAEEGDEGAVAHRPDLQVAALLWRELFPAGSRVLGVEAGPPALADRTPAWPWIPTDGGVPWLPTAAAARRIRKLGLELSAPDPEVVRRVHDKAFALQVARRLGLCPLGGQVRLFAPEELGELPAAVAALGPGEWAIKPRFGSSGRGRIPLHGGRQAVLGNAARRLARTGGAVLEPWLDRVQDLSVQLHVGRDGGVELLGSTVQLLTSSGVYLGNRCVLGEAATPRAGTRWDEQLEAAALQLGQAAAREGFFGPCGVDAFVYRDAAGSEVLRPVVELNARYTMGTVALGLLRRLQLRRRTQGARAFVFTLRQQAAAPGVEVVPLPGGAAALLEASS